MCSGSSFWYYHWVHEDETVTICYLNPSSFFSFPESYPPVFSSIFVQFYRQFVAPPVNFHKTMMKLLYTIRTFPAIKLSLLLSFSVSALLNNGTIIPEDVTMFGNINIYRYSQRQLIVLLPIFFFFGIYSILPKKWVITEAKRFFADFSYFWSIGNEG